MLEGEKLEGARLLRSCSLCQELTPPCCSAELVQVGDVPVEALQFRYEQQQQQQAQQQAQQRALRKHVGSF